MSIILRNSLILENQEDYKTIGSSRLGGKPDLPTEMIYPILENGFYEFILQINLYDFQIGGLPKIGLLSLFFGGLDNNEAKGFYFDTIDNLETKNIPLDEKYAVYTDSIKHVSYKIKIESNKIESRSEQVEYNDEQFTEEDNIMHWKMDFLYKNSYLMDKGVEDKSMLYLKSNGFDRLAYGFGLRIDEVNHSIIYFGRNSNKIYSKFEDVANCKLTTSYENQRDNNLSNKWLEQFELFEKEKKYHLERFKEFKCILSLASMSETGMIWGDLHKLEIYGYETDILKNNFGKLCSAMP